MEETTEIKSPATVHMPFLIARESAMFLAIQLMVIELIFVIILFVILVPIANLITSGAIEVIFTNVLTYIAALVALIKIIIAISLSLTWVGNYYEIHPEEIIHKEGIFTLKETIFSCKNIQEIHVTQSLLGKFFNYGTITLYNPLLKKRFSLMNIADPQRRCEVIQQQVGLASPELPVVLREGS